MSIFMASIVVNCQKESWLLSLLYRVMEFGGISIPKLVLPYNLAAYSDEQYISCPETWVLPMIITPLWFGLVSSIVSPVQWGRCWSAQSGCKILLSDQILWFGAWPGAALALISISRDFGRGVAEARWSPGFSAAGFLWSSTLSGRGVLSCLLRIQFILLFIL